MLVRWKAAVAHVLRVSRDRRGGDLTEFGITLDEFGPEVAEDAQHVVDDEDLPVTGRRGADTDGWNRYLSGDAAASTSGTFSSTTAKAPASATARASLRMRSASSPLPCTR